MAKGADCPPAGYRSGALARAGGVSVDTLRHYERCGVLARPRRLGNGYRLYPASALGRVRLIQRALSVGFTIRELTRLLAEREAGAPPCREVRALALQKLAAVEQQIEELARFRKELRALIGAWDLRLANTADGKAAELLESLGKTADGNQRGASSLRGARFARRLRNHEEAR